MSDKWAAHRDFIRGEYDRAQRMRSLQQREDRWKADVLHFIVGMTQADVTDAQLGEALRAVTAEISVLIRIERAAGNLRRPEGGEPG